MTTVNEMDGKLVVIVKGAFDIMATRCIAGDLTTAAQVNAAMSENALRVLAVGCRIIDAVPEEVTPELLEKGPDLPGPRRHDRPRPVPRQETPWPSAARPVSAR